MEHLKEENEQLKGKINDLQGALKARDLELKQLREEYDFLIQAMEQQDKTIAEIVSEKQSVVQPAKTMIKARLDAMGFQSSQVDSVLDDLAKTSSPSPFGREAEVLNVVLDRLLVIEPLHPTRKRRSVSDFGLLKSDYTSGDKLLFAGLDEISLDKENQVTPTPAPILSYASFLERVNRPACRDVKTALKLFVRSVLGPDGDGTLPKNSSSEFVGLKDLGTRCNEFLVNMETALTQHPAWCYANEETLLNARDGIEKYVMEQLHDIALTRTPESKLWKDEDERLFKRMHLLSFVTPDMLDVKPCMRNEVVWSIAEDELRQIHTYRAPGDKIKCIVRCCSVLFSALNLSRGIGTKRPGADDFLPVFIYVVLRSRIPMLYSNCEYISMYRNQTDLMSKAGYCLVNLRSALEFISVLEPSMLTVDPQEFQDKLKASELAMENVNGDSISAAA